MSTKKVQKTPPKILIKRVEKSSKLEFAKEEFNIPDDYARDSYVTRPERCDQDCKHRYNDCKALIDNLNKELSFEKGQRLKMEQR